MAYWWVSQNKTFKHERDGGYLWAPVRDKAGNTPHHWQTMTVMQPGDVVFSYVRQAIPAISVASSSAVPSAQPGEFVDQDLWLDEGYRIDVEYEMLPNPLPVASLLPELLPLLPAKYSPLKTSGGGNLGYLFALPPRAGELLLERIGKSAPEADYDPIEKVIERAELTETEKEALVKSRVGQGRFRDDLLRLWGGRCCVTGAEVPELLRASHIKPWRDSNHKERLDPFNGLLLSPTYDAAFDSGLITFNDRGRIHVSPVLDARNLERLGMSADAVVEGIEPQHVAYLRHHREVTYRGERA